jgi:hypothetical protein
VHGRVFLPILTASRCIVSSLPNPPLPAAPSNEYYGQHVVYSRISHQIPTIIAHINTRNLPIAPRPLAGLPLSRTFPELDLTPDSRRSPSVWSLQRPWEPFLPSSPSRRATITPHNQLARDSQGRFFLLTSAIESLTGPGSVLKEVESRVLPFLSNGTQLDIFGTWKDAAGPDSHLLLSAAREFTNVTDLRSRLNRRFSSKERALEEAEPLNHGIDSLEAIDQYAVRVALDACALLGGVELPTWPVCVDFAGSWLEEANPNMADKPASYISQCRARDCERWGVPCWLEAPRRHYSRLDVTPIARPTGDRGAEALHQQWLRKCPPDQVKKVYIPTIVRSVDRSSPSCALPSPEAWKAVKTKIQLLLDDDASAPLAFNSFNREMGQLLDKGIWSGKQYEAQRHSDRSVCWLTAREGAQEILHRGVIHASFEIPSTWGSPQTPVVDKHGVERLTIFEGEGRGFAESAVAAEAWFGVELVGYPAGQEEEAQRVASSYNALGYRFVQAPQQLKDAQGRTIPRSLYQIELLFKSRRQQQDACREIRAALPSLTNIAVSLVDLESFSYDRLNQFHLKADPHYINRLYEEPLPTPERQRLVDMAPSYPVPPATHTTPSDIRATQEAVYLWRLVHFSLLEYDGECMIPGYAPRAADAAYAERIAGKPSSMGASSSQKQKQQTSLAAAASPQPLLPIASPRMSLPVAELPLARLGEIAFSSSLPFPAEDVDKLRRLYLCLWAGKRRAPFSASLVPFPGLRFRELLAHVTRLVEESSLKGVVEFNYRMGPPNSSLGPWDEKLLLDGHGRVKISMDPGLVQEWDATRDFERMEEYVTRCMQLSGVSRLQKRRKWQAQQAGKGKEKEMEMEIDP